MKTARQSSLSLSQCVAPAFARLFARQATAGMRPPKDGRWLTGFKDLWLTGPLTAPKGRETWAFLWGRTPPIQGSVNAIS